VLRARILSSSNSMFENTGVAASILVGLLSLGVIWLGVWYIASEDVKRTEASRYQDTANLARAFEEHIIRLIQANDQILLFARSSISKDPERFDLAQWARDQQFTTDVTLQIATTDKTGLLTGSNLGMPPTPTDLSDREHFRVHAESSRDELFISKPVLGRVSGKWSIQLSRRLNAADGSFAGVVILSIDPSYLASFYESIDISKDGMVFLVGLDGIVRARVAGGDQTIGQSLATSTLFTRLSKSNSGSFLAGGQMDGIARLASYRLVKGYPLVVVVGLSRAEVFANVEYRRMLYFLMAGFVSILVLVFNVHILRHQVRLWTSANIDSLTDLPNRKRFHRVVNEIISDAQNGVESFSLLLLDLDNFKQVNDTLGHEAGDLVLRTAAERIKRMSRNAELVARLGGDEFALLVRSATPQRDIALMAQRVMRALRRKMDYRGHSIKINATMGIAYFPDHGATWSDIFRAADLALYRAKQAGRNRIMVFESTMLLEAEQKFEVLASVRSAIENDCLVPFYQPEISLETGEVVGFEALARIVLDDGRISMPAAFLSALEDPEVGRAFGLRMIDRVTRDLKAWLTAGFDIKRVAINVSNLELRTDDYAEHLISVLRDRGIAPDRFEIEVTETAAFDDIAAITRNLQALATEGVSIALDDFGTGFASLTHLTSLPITRVKIAPPFIGGIVADLKSRSVVDGIVRISHGLGKSVVVEGVEDEAQLAAIRELNCDVVQGFLFSRPLPLDQVPAFLLRHSAQNLRGAARWDESGAPAEIKIRKVS
jgi:diguanylate cyclase (GGDEF)-like protein